MSMSGRSIGRMSPNGSTRLVHFQTLKGLYPCMREEQTPWPRRTSAYDLRIGNALEVLRGLPRESVHCCVTSPPYWGLRDYGVTAQVWGGDHDHEHIWGPLVLVNATNHTDRRRWNHARNGRGEERGQEERLGRERQKIGQGSFCDCGAWRGSL